MFRTPAQPTNPWGTLEHADHSATLAERYDPNDTWAIYWYLCGTDLESRAGLASIDLQEMLAVDLPSNVTVIIEAGGTKEWHNGLNPDYNTRLIYSSTSDGLETIQTLPAANMGKPDTLEAFLRFCNENYPADHQIVIFWDHGGGSLSGVIFDEKYHDSLSLEEIGTVFAAVCTPSATNPPYEMIGFDACLMATIEMADTLSGYAKWMVASQEVEPGIGWNYTGFLQALANDTGIGGAWLGKVICDEFYDACRKSGEADDVTLSVVDLRLVDELMAAYHNVGVEALLLASENTLFFSDFGRAATRAQNYGSNNSWDGYTNMADLGDLIIQSSYQLLPEYGDDLLIALDNCVVYQVKGVYRERATGLSCYYNYSGNVNDYVTFARLNRDSPFRWYYYYELTGGLSDEGLQFLQEMAFIYAPEIYTSNGDIEPAPLETAAVDDLEDWPVATGADGSAVLNLGPEIAGKLVGVYGYIAYYDEKTQTSIFLGRNNDIAMDWENGMFSYSFHDTWGCLDGTLVFMELTDEADEYQLYMVPILLNGEEYSLSIAYTFANNRWTILGARKGLDENGMADKDLQPLHVGDVVEPLHYVMLNTTNDDAGFEQMAIEKITITANTQFYERSLGDGLFFYMFEMIDVQGYSYLSEIVIFSVKNGEVSILDDF